MHERQLEAFIHFHEGTARVLPELLSAADLEGLHQAYTAGAFVQAQTNMGLGYSLVGIVNIPSGPGQAGHGEQAFVLIYSGEAATPLPEP